MIKIETHINSSIQNVWEMWTTPEHICNWNFADVDWHCPAARVDLTVGGSFTYTMAARDASFQFDFSGTYTSVVVNERIDVILEDGRLWNTTFEQVEGGVKVTEEFDPENENPEDMQRMGWQMILDRFKNYVESASS
jgi:uncharacterized protein YndB with AHSA1/START domain